MCACAWVCVVCGLYMGEAVLSFTVGNEKNKRNNVFIFTNNTQIYIFPQTGE